MQTSNGKYQKKICPSCAKSFDCGDNCWCSDLPAIMPVNPQKGCCCKSCLMDQVKEKINEYTQTLSPEKVKEIKNLGKPKKPVEGIDYYINEAGLFVFTAWYHLRRGDCCGNNCKHCPYKEETL